MRACSYHAKNSLNLHHLEGDVWSHTLLSYRKGTDINVSSEVLLALLLHDIGRALTRYENEENSSVHFGDFEGVSCFVALSVLDQLQLSEKQKVHILKIIMHQYTVIDFVKYAEISWNQFVKQFEYDEGLLTDLFAYVQCDLFGRVVDKSKESYYDFQKMQHYHREAMMLTLGEKQIQKKKKDLFILIGLPCSGKSTWIKQYQKNAYILGRDRCIDEIGAKHGVYTHNEAYALHDENKNIAEEVNILFSELLKKSYQVNEPIVIDNLNITPENRLKWVRRYEKTHNVHGILFLKSLPDLLKCDEKRQERDNKSIGKELYLKHMMKFKFPLLNEGFDSIDYIFT